MKNKITILWVLLLHSYDICSQNTFSADCQIGSIRSLLLSSNGNCILLSKVGPTRISEADTSTGAINWTSHLSFPVSSGSNREIIQTSDGNYLALITQIGTAPYIAVYKISSSGNFMWIKKYFATATNNAYGFVPTQDGGFIMVGGGCAGSNFVIRCDSLGNIIWQKQYREASSIGGTAYKIVYAGNNNYYVAATNMNLNFDTNDVLFKINDAGNLLWFRKIVMSGPSSSYALTRTMNGGATITGSDSSSSGIYLAHFDSTGNNLWIKSYIDNEEGNYANDIIQLFDSSYLITGAVFYADIRNVQMAIIKTDPNGNFVRARTAGKFQNGGGYDDSFCIKTLSTSSYMVGGHFSFSKLDIDGFGWCYSDSVNMLSIIPTYTIETPPSIIISNLNFNSDTINYTYSLFSGNPCSVCTNTTNVIDINDASINLSIAPNPFSNTLNIIMNDNLKYRCNIYDVSSRIYFQEEFSNALSLNTEKFPAGIYFYEVCRENGSCVNGKVIKY